MKIQYFGDVSDYRKYALLRLFSSAGFKVGVCWVMTPSDNRNDGKFRAYLDDQTWQRFDPELYSLLKRIPKEPRLEDLQAFEASEIIPNAIYYNALTPNALKQREIWHLQGLEKLSNSDLVFFDPDNGIEVATYQKGRLNSNKYIFYNEIRDFYKQNKSVLIYQHFPRRPRDIFIAELLDRLSIELPEAKLRVFSTAHVAFILASQPEHENIVATTERKAISIFVPTFFSQVTSLNKAMQKK